MDDVQRAVECFEEWLRFELAEGIRRPAWMSRAACRGQDTNAFFPARGRSNATAKATCAACPVQSECLDYALALGDAPHGIFAGLVPAERRATRRNAA